MSDTTPTPTRRPKTYAKFKLLAAEYVATRFNGVQAWLRVFPGANYGTAKKEMSKIVTTPDFLAELEIARQEYAERMNCTPGRLTDRLVAIAFADIRDAFTPGGKGQFDTPVPLTEMDPLTRSAIQVAKAKMGPKGKGRKKAAVIEVEYKMHSPMEALEKLCKIFGLYDKDPPPTDPDKPPAPPMTEAERLERIQAILLAAHGRLKAQEQAAAEKPAEPLPEGKADAPERPTDVGASPRPDEGDGSGSGET